MGIIITTTHKTIIEMDASRFTARFIWMDIPIMF